MTTGPASNGPASNGPASNGPASAARPPIAGWTLYIAIALLLVPLLLRAPITSVPPALTTIADHLSFGPAVAGLATTLPLVCFGVFAFVAPGLVSKTGMHVALLVAVVLTVIGMAIRSVPTTWTFFGGVTVIGLGIAIGNVVIPALIRADFPHRLAVFMGLYTLGLQSGATLGSLATAPLLAVGLNWQQSLGVWVIPALLITVLWAVAAIRVGSRAKLGPRTATPIGVVARRPLTIAICLFMGLQSLTFYTLLTWLPEQSMGLGMTQTQAGLMLGLFTMLGAPGSFLGPRLTQERWGPAAILVLFGAYVVAILLLFIGPGWAVAAAAVLGLCQGISLAVALTFIAHQATPADVPAVSAIAQGTGYSLAAVGPVAFGWLFELTSGWVIPNSLLIVLCIATGLIGAWIARTEARRRHARPVGDVIRPTGES